MQSWLQIRMYIIFGVLLSPKYFKEIKNPRIFAYKYIIESAELEIIYSQQKPWLLDFSINLGSILTITWIIEELLIDSTFKTNEGLDLFVIIGYYII